MKRFAPVFAALAIVLAGCGKGKFTEANQDGGLKVFKYPIVTNPTTLDPGMVQDGDTIDLLQQIYEGLVMWNEDNTVQPMLAESWEVKNDGKVYVFKLKPGIKFHNGRAITAADFKWSIERNTAKNFNSPVSAGYLNDIMGMDEYHAGNASEVTGIRVVDDSTLEIELVQPRAYFLGKLTYIASAVLPKEVVPQDKEMTQTSQMIGAGAFKMESFTPEAIVVLAANKEYHGGAPLIDKIERPVIKDAQTRLNKFKAGEIDLVMLERQDIVGVEKDAVLKADLKFYDRPSIFYIGMNQKAYAPFKDRRVRRAIAMAINKEQIVKEILGGVNVVANSIVPPGVVGHRDNAAFLPYDPVAAKKELAAAGYADGSKLPPLEIRFREQRPDIRIVAQAVSNDLQKNLGIKTTLLSMEWRAYLERWNKGETGFFHMRWAADYLDSQNFLSQMLATFGPEVRGINYNNPEFDRLCREADASVNAEERAKLYAQAEDIALQDAPWAPIYFQRDAELIKSKVKGLRESLFGHLPHTKVSLEE